MITCSQCGGTNDLGRVFCTTCGAKLELTALSNEEVPIRGQGGSGGKIAAAVVVMILVSALVLAGLCFVPVSDAIGEQGSPSSVHNVAGPLRALSGLRSGQSLGRSFPESDINGYLALAVVKRARVEGISVDVKQDAIAVRLIRKLGPYKIGSRSLSLPVTYQVTYSPDGGSLRRAGARMGYLPLFGPLKSFAFKPIEEVVTSQHEWRTFRDVKAVRAGKDAVWVEISR